MKVPFLTRWKERRQGRKAQEEQARIAHCRALIDHANFKWLCYYLMPLRLREIEQGALAEARLVVAIDLADGGKGENYD